MTAPLLLSLDAVAEQLSVSRRTVEAIVQRGELAVVHIGRAVRVRPAVLAAYVDRAERAPGARVTRRLGAQLRRVG